MEAGIPVIPGSSGSVNDLESARKSAQEIGYPVIIKAAAGGGGKGMRIVYEEPQLASALKIASHEAEAAFSDGTVYLEKYMVDPRHVEVQIVADKKGNVVHLGERDCSLQKNHQKIVEESPSPGMKAEIRQKMCADAVRLFKKLKYHGAGTIEFLFNGDKYFFMEVNARVQVEHPVSEMISGIDIIEAQILGCSDAGLGFTQKDIELNGASIECRINASAPGKVERFLPSGGRNVRVDSFLINGCTVPPHYDSLVAKIIVYGINRIDAIKRMNRALDEFILEGIPTNIDTQKKIVRSALFKSGKFGTSGLETILKE